MNDIELKVKEADYFGSWVVTIVIFSLITYFGGIIFSSLIMIPHIIGSFFKKYILKLIVKDNTIFIRIGDQLGLKKKNYTFKPNELGLTYKNVSVYGSKSVKKELKLYYKDTLIGRVMEDSTKMTLKDLNEFIKYLKEIGVKEVERK